MQLELERGEILAQSVVQLNDQPPLKPYIDLPHLSELVQAMVRKSLDAFVRRDTELATEVCQSDDAVDGLYKQIFRELLTYMMEDPRNIGPCTHLLFIAKNLERIGDHATNIAEAVYYMVEGHSFPAERPKADTTTGIRLPITH